MKAKGVHCQVWITMTEISASRRIAEPVLAAEAGIDGEVVDDAEFGRQHEGAPDHADHRRATARPAGWRRCETALAALHVHHEQRQRQARSTTCSTTVEPV